MNFRLVAVALLYLAGCSQPAAINAEDLRQRYDAGAQSYENAFAAFERDAKSGEAYGGNLKPLAIFLRATMRQRRDEKLRERGAAYLATMPGFGTDLRASDYLEIAEAIPANSSEWIAAQDVIRRVVEGLPAERARVLLEEIAAKNESRMAQGQALISLAQLERRERRMEAFTVVYQRLAPYRDVEGLSFSIKLLNPSNRVAVGKPVPAFALDEVGADNVVTSGSLRGRYYLIDFWATWCGPCIGERAALARAQRRFGGKDFTVVSISLDEKPSDAAQFRARRWPMPWVNLFLPNGLKSEMAKEFDLSWIGLPQLILVSPEGEVLALRDQLEGQMLERTLSIYVSPAGH